MENHAVAERASTAVVVHAHVVIPLDAAEHVHVQAIALDVDRTKFYPTGSAIQIKMGLDGISPPVAITALVIQTVHAVPRRLRFNAQHAGRFTQQ